MTAAAGNSTDVSPNRSSDASPNPDANGPNFEVCLIIEEPTLLHLYLTYKIYFKINNLFF